LFLFALAADLAWWWTVVGPLAMTAMFVFASIPMLDRRSTERRPEFAAYAARTPALVPRPPRRP
jgi:steroid 5-alpha reductase family enzyme